MTKRELIMLQALPLEVKIEKTKLRLREAIDRYGVDGLYLSFSGGKDSTVLKHIIEQITDQIPSVFVNTGLELPQITSFAQERSDTVLRPKMSFVQVIKKYGYPVISKEQSYYIHQIRHTKSARMIAFRREGINRDGSKTRFCLSEKYKYLLDSDIPISSMCCDVMKKAPFKKYNKETGRIPIIASMAIESAWRENDYLRNGCNAFNGKYPKSTPISFWTEQDVLQYIYEHDLCISEAYGQVVKRDDGSFYTTGEQRTGCVFCAFGVQREKGENRFERLKHTNPQLYAYCMEGGAHDEKGMWRPDKGLGMEYVLNVLKVRY